VGDGEVGRSGRLPAVPGVVVVFDAGRARQRFFRADGGSLELGRAELTEGSDPLISRRHLRLAATATGFEISDLASRNGTFVEGARLVSPASVPFGALIRAGGVLLLAVEDVVPFEHYGLGVAGGIVGGPSLRASLELIGRGQRSRLARSLLITGETGSGKEIAARVFHESGAAAGAPYVAVNCAAIPADLAERLLFGARRGAFSGATDALGYVHAARQGTLFLDEIAELSLEVQSKLLRVIETREVLRLGATAPERADMRICAATWRDLRAEVAAGRFRQDLYFRIGQPEVRLLPLRDRREEIPWHVQEALDEQASLSGALVTPSAEFVEACMLRQWPGNVRELRAEALRASALVAARGEARLLAEDLSQTAGSALFSSATAEPTAAFPEDEIAAALKHAAGSVAGAARHLGVDRNKIRRWLIQHRLDPRVFKP